MVNLKKQSSITNQFNRHVAYCKKIPAGTLVFEIKERLKNITSLYQEFRDLQDQIEEACGDELINAQFSLRAQVEDYYFLCVSALQSEIDKLNRVQATQNPPLNNNQGNQTADIKLERINIPVFTGDYKNWPEFKDLFSSLVHTNQSLGDVQKFHYLKNKVSGEALNLIKSLHTTGANYPEAWNRINERYEHKRFIVDCHLKSFFSQKAISTEDSLAIKQLIDNSTEIMRSLQVLGLPVNQWDSILVHVVASKLDKETHKHWELTLKKDNLPTFKELETFLENRWQSLEMIDTSKTETTPKMQVVNNLEPNNNKSHQNLIHKPNSSQRSSSNNSTKNKQCIYCNTSGHITGYCPEYISLSQESKKNFIKSKNLCFNCLKPGHSLAACTNKSSCQQCGKRHHTSIHRTNQPQSSNANNSDNPTAPIVARAVIKSPSPSTIIKTEKLLATAIVKIENSSGQLIRIRALIDLGSGYTLISEKLAKKLGFIQKAQNIPILGIGEVVAQEKTSKLNIKIQSNIDASFNLEVETFTMKVVTGDLPSAPIERKNWDHLQGIKLADDHYDRTSPIDLLLGVEVFEEIILDGIIKKQNNSPTAMNSRLGWLLFGALASKSPCYPEIKCHNVSIVQEDINQAIKKFWELEEVSTLRKLTASEQQAEDIFESNVSVNKEGRYEVPLLFNPNTSGKVLGESRIAALFCLYRMEKRFQTNQILKERYHKYIQNLIDSGHIEPVPYNRSNLPVQERFYLPHHGVTKESSITTKLRVVFNASRKSTSGVSLNDKLLVGPSIQEDLFSILIRWRKYRVAFIADIEKMYRQIKIIQNHRDFQRLLWRFSPNDPVLEFRITTVIDGTASATFLATRTLKQAALDGQLEFPEASEVIKRDFYMDDVSSGEDSIESTIKLQNDLIKILNKRGFLLKKWFSNKKEIMDNVPIENRHEPDTLVELIDTTIKTLGIFWNPKEDSFEFKVATSKPVSGITKRSVLSDIAKLFDPIGWLAPTTVVAKIFMQSLWNVKDLDWNNKLPKTKFKEWQLYRNQLSSLQKIKIPRWIGTTKAMKVQLHGFCDASISAYASVIYIRTVLNDGTIIVNLISGKTKVAPIKTISIPKLELCGCLMLANLVTKIKSAFNFQMVDIHLYSDSTVALAWIDSQPNLWNVFVANRITDIQQLSETKSWHYINTNDNPADCASKGVMPSKLKDHPLWWQGPSWLVKDESEWPNQREKFETELEKRKIIRSLYVTQQLDDDYMLRVLKNHSNLIKLQRRTAFILRWSKLNKSQSKYGIPTACELRNALKAWIKFTQMQSFPDEISSCLNNDELHQKSKLTSLRPFLDDEGILRVGGRLKNSKLAYESKHPVILPKRHHLTKLIIEQAHQLTLHGGPSLMSSFLSKYWIFGKCEQIKRVVKNCVICFPFVCKPQEQVMADLPANRVTQHRSFLHTGVDFAGPFETKSFIGRCRGKYSNTNTKGYASIFVCLVTKAVHIEYVSDLTSQKFLDALKRFSARKGKASDLYSDCGTNFVGADNILQEQMKILMEDPNVKNYIAADGTTWHFNPPATPHFGGIFEAAVKSMKYHLRRLVGKKTFTFEEMTTMLSQVEACLNSRPICPMNHDINDNNYLTPGHFVIGEPPITMPEPSLLHSNINRLSRWQLVQRIYQEFWHLWSNDYLSSLQQRNKWTKEQDNVRVGQLVIYREDNVPPAKWPMARIIEIHPGSDNNTRVVTIKTPTTVLKRPINKISVLPIIDNQN